MGAKRKPLKDMEWWRGPVLGERVGCHVMELKRKIFWNGINNTEPPHMDHDRLTPSRKHPAFEE